MYVCVCHALRERDVQKAIEAGCRNTAEVHDHFGVETQCGRCAEKIEEALDLQGCGCAPLASAA